MNYLKLLLLVLSSYIINCAAYEQKFGLISTEGKSLCVSFGDKAPAVNSSITIVAVEGIQFAFEAKIGEKTEKCKLLENAQVVGPYFTVITNGKYESPFVGVAVFGKSKVSTEGGVVSLNVVGGKENIYFRLCTSSEALHFSSWLGSPLIGKQLWRQYYYLGYDTEPSCEERDFQVEEKT